jgi:glucokinase
MNHRASIGIDIGGTKTLFALFNDDFDVVEEVKMKTEAEKGEKHFIDGLTEALEELVKKAEKEKLNLAAVGIGAAGVIEEEKGSLRECPAIPFLKDYPLRARVAKLTGADVFLMNDVMAGLYGETQFGAAVGCRNVIGVFFGTGIGGAAILNGLPYLGGSGRAGDIGHYVLRPAGASNERAEMLDDLCSRTAIAGDAASLAAKQQAPHLLKAVGTDVSEIRSKDLAEAIAKGDEAVAALVKGRIRLAGMAISNFVDFLNPEMVILGGGLVAAMPKIITREIEEAIRLNCTPDAAKAVRVAAAKLKDHAGTTGAAKMALDVMKSAPVPG